MAQNMIFCAMYMAATQTLNSVDEVNAAVDTMSDGEHMAAYRDYAGYLPLLHGLPYLFILSLLLFTGFWATESAGKCCGSKCGVVLYIFHFILCLICIVIAAVIAGAYMAIRNYKDQIDVTAAVATSEPTNLEDLLNHIQVEYPELWDLVFADFSNGGERLGQAFIVFLVIGIFVLLYGVLVCIIRPYKKDDKDGAGQQ